MASWPILLRVLLALALVLNGTGAAVAGIGMDLGLLEAQAVSHSADAGELPCHQSEAPSGNDGAVQPSDCCQTGACSCACAHVVQMICFSGDGKIDIPSHGCVRVRVMTARAAPILLQLTRPPIV
ncbi:CopL family metal-binding regulatory protein [Luteimonas mephitis]|uniref:CopL family metal-binding regulatory protein n=1 Tax=Luteimonas mephitis TaxID=83615 RepID=UPI00146A358B